ncbi:CPBP family intramembrane metalloprotease [Candidatus Bathyarchaeota archaeon]|nr:CPBP family intramembrane metalloprotease [Candidatus Bathyarchaeota archaeon]
MDRLIVYYFSLVLLIGSLVYAPWVLASYGVIQSDLVFVFVIVGGISPTIAALIVAKLEFRGDGAEYLFSQFGRKGFSKWWFLAAVLVPLVLAVCSVLLLSTFGGSYTLDLMKLTEFAPILITSFLMNMWEEIGWRGYALPALQKKHNALVSSLIVGVFWALWHWPLLQLKTALWQLTIIIFFGSLFSCFFTPYLIRGFTILLEGACLPHRYIMHQQTRQTLYCLLKQVSQDSSFHSTF